MTGRLIAIGDIHGCRAALESLWEAISPTAEDTIVTLGDYVDRGPDSKGVIDLLIEYAKQCKLVAIQGNHEEMMLNVLREKLPPHRWLQFGGVDTLDSYGFVGDLKVIPESHHAFFKTMVNYYETDNHIFIHANYDPVLPLEKQGIFQLRWLKLTESTPQPHVSGKRVVVGHTHDRGGQIFDVGHLICIDTFCYGGGWLTALDVNSGRIWQANREGGLRGQ
ncbi:MAG: metallophosphoesterase family protein [Pirellulales bacterium]